MSENFYNGSICLLIGVVLIIVYYFFKRKYDKLLSTGIPAEGVIFEFEESEIGFSSTDSNISNPRPVIRFVTLKQEWITEVYKDIAISTWRQGDKVKVYYDPDNPKNFVLSTPLIKWIIPAFLMIGILLVIVSIVLYILD